MYKLEIVHLVGTTGVCCSGILHLSKKEVKIFISASVAKPQMYTPPSTSQISVTSLQLWNLCHLLYKTR